MCGSATCRAATVIECLPYDLEESARTSCAFALPPSLYKSKFSMKTPNWPSASSLLVRRALGCRSPAKVCAYSTHSLCGACSCTWTVSAVPMNMSAREGKRQISSLLSSSTSSEPARFTVSSCHPASAKRRHRSARVCIICVAISISARVGPGDGLGAVLLQLLSSMLLMHQA